MSILWGIVVILSVSVATKGGLVKNKPYYDVTDRETCRKHFEDFISEYNKTYYSEKEKRHRFEIFIESLKLINERNKISETCLHDITRFSDLTAEEFRSRYTGYVRRPDYIHHKILNAIDVSHSQVPDSFDWRHKNVVSRVKDQGVCNSCWAFSAIGALESQYALKHHKIVEFSVQQLISCDKCDKGCVGGEQDTAFRALKEMNGVESEKDYPYKSGRTNVSGHCTFDKSKVKAVVIDHYAYNFNKMTEDDVKALLVKKGPLAISIDSGGLDSYHGGIEVSCEFDSIDHAVLLVGYGVDNGHPFWTIKNSWGIKFGEDGYFRMKRGVNCLGFMTDYGGMVTVK